MEKTNLWPCPLDQKNICAYDWMEEEFGNNWMATPDCKNGKDDYLTFVDDILVELFWRFGTNQLSFLILHRVSGCETFMNEQRKKVFDKIKAIVSKIENWDNDSKIVVRYNEDGDRIDFFFYYDNVD